MSLLHRVSPCCPSTRSIVPASRRIHFQNTPARLVMRKRGIHPEYYDEAKVYCKGEHVLTVSGTQEEYHVDIWSGNHPLFQGKERTAPVDDGPLAKFMAKYGDLDPELMVIPSLGSEEPEGLDKYKKKSKKSKK